MSASRTTRGKGSALLRAELSWEAGEVPAAVDACYDALREHERDARVHALLGDLFLAGDFYEEAIVAASRAIELDAECAPAYLALGMAYDRRGGMWDRSVLVWAELAEVVPDLVTAHVQLGEALSAASFEEEAIAAWRQALELDPNESRAMYNLAVSALKAEGMTTALPGFRRAGQLDPSEDQFFFGLSASGGTARSAPAVAALAADSQSRIAGAFAHALAEDYFAASEVIRELLAENPDDAEALSLAAFLYLKQEATNEAMAVALRSLAVNAKTSGAVYVLGSAFARMRGLERNATRVFGALAKAVPGHPMSHVLLAESQLGVQRYSEAKSSYLRAVRLDPTVVRARFGLAAVLLAEGEHSRAAYEISRAAYHDTKRQALFAALYHDYAGGGRSYDAG